MRGRNNLNGVAAAFCHRVRVYYEDTDAAGVVYYANYLRFMERARSECLRAAGFPVEDLSANEGRAFVVRHVAVDYAGFARLGDLLEVSVAPDANLKPVHGAVINLEQTIRLEGTIIVSARVTLACVNTETFRPVRVPEKIVEVFVR